MTAELRELSTSAVTATRRITTSAPGDPNRLLRLSGPGSHPIAYREHNSKVNLITDPSQNQNPPPTAPAHGEATHHAPRERHLAM